MIRRSRATARDLVGRKIVAVQMNRFYTGSRWSTDPTIVFDNGKRMFFTVDETGAGSYGVSMRLWWDSWRKRR